MKCAMTETAKPRLTFSQAFGAQLDKSFHEGAWLHLSEI